MQDLGLDLNFEKPVGPVEDVNGEFDDFLIEDSNGELIDDFADEEAFDDEFFVEDDLLAEEYEYDADDSQYEE